MAVGDPSYWARHFTSIDDKLLERVAAVWPQCLSVLPASPEEDAITINLVHLLSKDSEARKLFHWLEYQFEPFGFTVDGLAFSKGQIDMAVLLDRDRERYLAYECKRLNVCFKSGLQSLATRYVTEGLIRFITEQYAEGLPVGCMLGYVLDGDTEIAIERVHAAMDANKAAIGLTGGPGAASSRTVVTRFTTEHVRAASGVTIHVRHSMLPFPKDKPQRAKQVSKTKGASPTP